MTSGADGNASPFSLPGGFGTMISGIGVFYPDKAPTQRVGIIPNVEIRRQLLASALEETKSWKKR
jgi:hypothetical protein